MAEGRQGYLMRVRSRVLRLWSNSERAVWSSNSFLLESESERRWRGARADHVSKEPCRRALVSRYGHSYFKLA